MIIQPYWLGTVRCLLQISIKIKLVKKTKLTLELFALNDLFNGSVSNGQPKAE